MSNLNQGQQDAAKAFFDFLLDDTQKFMVISGAGGTGKTFLMGHLIDSVIPDYHEVCELMGIKAKYYSVNMTATTNKAAEVLEQNTKRNCKTIHSLLGLTVIPDYKTGATKLIKRKDTIIYDSVIFIDEASMVSFELFEFIEKSIFNCKIVFVGDKSQLNPVMEKTSVVFDSGYTQVDLTEQMRNSGQPALMALCEQMRETVRTGEFANIHEVPGVIDFMSPESMEQLIIDRFGTENPNGRILCYSNAQVNNYNDYVREIRQLGILTEEGEILVSNSSYVMGGSTVFTTDREVEVLGAKEETKMVPIEGTDIHVEMQELHLKNTATGVEVTVMNPVRQADLTYALKILKSRKDWLPYYSVRERFPDLRPRDAATVHKSQGSTYEEAYIDLGNIGTCRNKEELARMLYVAISRAKNRIFLYGQLPVKYGELVYA